MTRKATLPKITECIDPLPRVSSFTEIRMLQALAAFVLMGALAVGHVHLQFLCTDMKFQQRELQKKLADLQQEEVKLSRANETFCDHQRLAQVATNDHMKEIDVRRQTVAMVPAALREKYQQPLRDTASRTAVVALTSGQGKVSERLLSLIDVSRKAQAAEKE
jgi:hypothetical protein